MTARILLLGCLTGLAGCTEPTPTPQSPAPRLQVAPKTASAAAPDSTAPQSAAPQSAARMPALDAGWQRVTPIQPRSLHGAIWDPQRKAVIARDDVGIYSWDGAKWTLLAPFSPPMQSQLIAHPDGARLVQLEDGILKMRALDGASIGADRRLAPPDWYDGNLHAMWHPQRKGVVLHFSIYEEQPGRPRSETWFDDGKRLIRWTRKGPYLMGLGWRDEQLVGFADKTVWRLQGTRWQPQSPQLPHEAAAIAPNGDLWMAHGKLLKKSSAPTQSIALPSEHLYKAPLAFDPMRQQMLMGVGSSSEGAGQIWISTRGAPFKAVEQGPWWRPADQAQGLVTLPDRLMHLHGPSGTVSRLTATGWQVEKADAPRPDPEWALVPQYGRWSDALVRLDLSGVLWRSNPWRAVKTEGRGPRIGQRDHSVALLGVGPRLLAHDEDGGATWALENGRWRALSKAPEREATPAMVNTAKGVYLTTGWRLWRLEGDAWKLVLLDKTWSINRLAYDAKRSALLAIGYGDDGESTLAVFEKDKWRALVPTPGGDNIEFGIASALRRGVVINEHGEGWMIDLDQLDYRGMLP